jgi:hypothetical protein
MALQHCTDEDRKIIKDCLRATVEGPFFEDWEFHTLFGLTRAEVARVLQTWPDGDGRDRDVDLAVNNALNNLLGYPHREVQAWERYIGVPKARVTETFERWREDRFPASRRAEKLQ